MVIVEEPPELAEDAEAMEGCLGDPLGCTASSKLSYLETRLETRDWGTVDA